MPLKRKIYQVDAFAAELFKGNPAAVMPLDEFLPAPMMQNIAMENNLAETAFFVPRQEPHHYDLRWFTPGMEIDFCGHATIATAHILFTELAHKPPYHFHVVIGDLVVDVKDGLYAMDAPIKELRPVPITEHMRDMFPGILDAYECAKDLMVILDSEMRVRNHVPDIMGISQIAEVGVIITGNGGTDFDCVSRYFAPNAGIDEDPVTGSAHAAIGPYWAGKLNKSKLAAYQASKRGGKLWLELGDERLTISGHAVTYMRGEIEI